MDPYALRKGNVLLGNNPCCAALEITGPGFECEFLADTRICVTGADLGCKVNEEQIRSGIVIEIKTGDMLGFKQINLGLRAYLTVKGGIDAPVKMGSRSMFRGEKLAKGDILNIGKETGGEGRGYYANSYIEELGGYVIRIRRGTDADLFPKKYLGLLLETQYTVSTAHDRMGIRLEAEDKPEPVLRSIITKPVFPGCIQLPGNGNPIIIMNDGQTTGGYPVWAVIERENLRIAGQLKAGDRIKFLHV
jgi:biotin-dependent carboxylase-like uncharacterized protein